MSSMGFGFGFRDLEPEGVHVIGQYRLWPYSSPYVGAFSRPGHGKGSKYQHLRYAKPQTLIP